jgi:hypothetical protein|tara:strand:+ start:539 stop:802 length:264 start_codon:yes stop_codon:yes gene_type:complete
MFKLLSELNIDKKDYKNLALLPGFNISGSNCMNEKFTLLNKKFDGSDILDEKVFIKLITIVDEGKNNSSKKRRKGNLKKSKPSRKKK